jgi:arylsulfatase A-like enzyme/Flp pilus assembly protein TadD
MLLSIKMNAVRLAAIGTLALAAGSAQRTATQPDIFLVTIDTLRADHVHCYGYEPIETPALDGLARDGIRFTNAFTPSPITNSSHASILTGMLPSVHGVTNFGAPLRPIPATGAELLKARGYQTAAFIGSVVLDSRVLAPGLNRGFGFYDNFPPSPQAKSRWGRLERRAMDVVGRAESWLDAHPTGPHFVWLHLYDPHDPYEPPAPFSRTYIGRLYDGEIAYADWSLTHFISYLKQHGLYRNAVIVVTGDHGEGLGDHGEDTHGIFLYDSTTHVPLILKLPAGTPAGKVIEAQVRTIDILPTLLDLSDAAVSQRFDGESLKPYISMTATPGRVLFGETDYPLSFGWAPLRSVRADGFKFIEAPRPELYELRPDPGETENRYEPWNERVQQLRAKLAEIRAHAPASASAKGAVSPQTIAELRALGYVGRADAGSATSVPEPSLLPDPKDKIEEENLLHKAMLASEAGHPLEARRELEQLLQHDHDSYLALRQLGELELDGGQAARAAEHLHRARELRPEDAGAAFYLGQALEKKHDFTGAREAVEASLKLLPGQFEARLFLGQIYLELKDAKAAEDQFEASLLLQPKSTVAKLWLARAHVASGRFADAVANLLQLVEIDRKNPDVYQLLSQAFLGMGKNTEAQAARVRSRMLQKHEATANADRR